MKSVDIDLVRAAICHLVKEHRIQENELGVILGSKSKYGSGKHRQAKKFRTGKRPITLNQINSLAKSFGVSVEELLFPDRKVITVSGDRSQHFVQTGPGHQANRSEGFNGNDQLENFDPDEMRELRSLLKKQRNA